MRIHTITAAGLAVSANALLLPPEISAADADVIKALPIEASRIAQSSSLKLACPGCPVPVRANQIAEGVVSIEGTTEIPSHLLLDFTIDNDADADRLLLNGFELYPNTDPLHQTLTAPLLRDIKDRRWRLPEESDAFQVPPQQLGFGLHVQNVAKSQEDLLELVELELQIIEVGNVFIDGIENVQVKMIKTANGKLMIQDLGTTASQTVLKTPMDKQEECTTLLCKWRAMLVSQLARLRTQKQCPGRKGHGTMPGHVQVDADGTHHLPGHRRPHPFGKAHHDHHDHHAHHAHRVHKHKHSWAQLLRNITSTIVLPVAIGIMAGVSVSLLGMLVGTFIVFLWRTFFRPASRRHHHRRRAGSLHKAAQREAAVADEKAGLMAGQEEEAPPAYIEEGIVASDDKTAETGV